jgi:hypothetical protein
LESRSPIAVGHNLPLSDLPNIPAIPTVPGKSRLVGRLGKAFARARGYQLNKHGKEGVLNLAETKGDDPVALVWAFWIKTRNLVNLACPFFKFVEEFEEAEAAMEKHAEDAQIKKSKADIRNEVEKSERDRKAWRIGLEAATDIDAFLAGNPCPPYFVDGGNKLLELPSDGPELIEQARHRLANPVLTKEQQKEMAEAAFL